MRIRQVFNYRTERGHRNKNVNKKSEKLTFYIFPISHSRHGYTSNYHNYHKRCKNSKRSHGFKGCVCTSDFVRNRNKLKGMRHCTFYSSMSSILYFNNCRGVN